VNKNISYDVCFCIDAIGLYIHKKSNIKSTKTINLSLEINDYSTHSFFLRQLKENEIKYLNSIVEYTLIQDPSRWEVLKKVTKYSKNNYLLLPNSCRLENIDKKDDFFFNRKFNVSNEYSIILSAGMINDEVLSLETAKVIGNSNTKNKIKIIFHNRVKSSIDKNEYLKEILNHGKDKVILSLDPVEYSELYKIFTSAKIGMVFYDKNNPDKNFSTIGAASGKLFQYIKYGLPIISTDNDGLKELVNQYNLGVVINNLSELPNAIDLILDNYEYYSNEVKNAFREKLNIDIYLDDIYSLIIETK
jgi:glycosyltransferase involved in cell wall biosynthesis